LRNVRSSLPHYDGSFMQSQSLKYGGTLVED
jgi:hypothetical protein